MSAFNEWMNTNGNSIINILLILMLIAIILLVIKLIILIGKLNKATDKINGSLNILQDYLGELKLPLRVLTNVSMSIEALRAAGEAQVKAMLDKIQDSFKKILELLKNIWHSISQIKKDKPESDDEPIDITPVTSETDSSDDSKNMQENKSADKTEKGEN